MNAPPPVPVPSRTQLWTAMLASMGETVLVLRRDGRFIVCSPAEITLGEAGETIGIRFLDSSHWPYLPTREVRLYLNQLYNELVEEWEGLQIAVRRSQVHVSWLPETAPLS